MMLFHRVRKHLLRYTCVLLLAIPLAVQADTVVNLNTATTMEIAQGLKGIGLKKAQAIVDYRNQHGAFRSLEELTLVRGIGPATIDKNRERIMLGKPSVSAGGLPAVVASPEVKPAQELGIRD